MLAVAIVSIIAYKQVPEDALAFVKNEEIQQRDIAEKQVDSLFVHKRRDIIPIYYECESRFVKGDFYAQTGRLYKDIINKGYTQPKLPTDITSTYRVAPEDAPLFGNDVIEDVKKEIMMHNRNDDDIESGIRGVKWKGLWQTGWALGVRENFGSGRIVEYIIIPYAVSFRKQSFGTLEGYITIDDILDNAFKFYTENDKSSFKRSIVKDTKHFTYMPQIDNNYYYLEAENNANFVTMTISDYADYERYMYNDSYYVFIKGYGRRMYNLVLNERHAKYVENQYIKNKRVSIFLYSLITLGLLLSLWAVLLVWIVKESREHKQTLLQRIIIKCNPKKFVKNYNVEKLKSANDIYSKAIATDVSDEKSIMELASRSENELGISLVSKNDIKELKALCNPKKFMKPYDPQKVEKANELYWKLGNGVVLCSEYQLIKKEIEHLYNKKPEESTSLSKPDDSSI